MDVDIWIDPICPFCWVTSRWLVQVAPERDLDITWRSISLFVKNGMADEPDHPYHGPSSRTHQLLRVVEAMRDAGGADRIGDLYAEFGRHIHHRGELEFDVAELLGRLGLDPALAEALTDEQWDARIAEHMDEVVELAGDDIGTPLIAVDGRSGRVALFGPVIIDVPDLADSLDLWDGFLKMVDVPGFFELKRTRTHAPNIPTSRSSPEAP